MQLMDYVRVLAQ